MQKLKLNDDPGWKVGLEELNYAVKPVLYRNPKFKVILSAIVLRSLASLNPEAGVQREMSRTASKIDKWLEETNGY
jgi:hypothetical protein